MSLAVEPLKFFARLLLAFVGFFAAWLVVGPGYTRFLAALAELTVSVVDRPTHVWSAGTTLFFWPRGYQPPNTPPSIAAEWIHANTILLLALMVATPASTWSAKIKRSALAFLFVLLWQVLDVTLAIQFGYATQLDPHSYTASTRYRLALFTNLAMYLDTQIVPFMIWAGIHFRQLLAMAGTMRGAAAAARADQEQGKSRPQRHSA
ncbi:hypothetical protein HRbin30_00408 [bacterium HR30]|nr:hypothetical protein HRbin30_00408 [bacterium HR30]